MKSSILNNQNKPIALAISAVAMCACVAVQAQTIIDPLNGTLTPPYTTYVVNDVSAGAGQGVSFTQSASGLQANYVGTGTTAEQALSLAPASSFSTTFAVGDTLEVSSTVAASSTAEDFGLAISANNPIAGNSGDSWNSRTAFDWASISTRPNQSGGFIRQNTSINGTLVTGSFNLSPTPSTVTGLYITWVSPLAFTLGYMTSSGLVPDDTVNFEAGSSIGSDIGFYGDLRTTGASLGDFQNLAIVPEPSTLSLCSVGLVGLIARARKWRK
jgi:hypothetical protein